VGRWVRIDCGPALYFTKTAPRRTGLSVSAQTLGRVFPGVPRYGADDQACRAAAPLDLPTEEAGAVGFS